MGNELETVPLPSTRTLLLKQKSVRSGTTVTESLGAAGGFTTTGVGTRSGSVCLGAEHVRAGDRVIVSGNLGDHGMAVLLARGEFALGADIVSDCASLQDLAAQLMRAAPNVRWMRDPTRGGLASALNELVRANGLSVLLDELQIPVAPAVAGACELLGIDAMYVANEGKLVAIVPPDEALGAIAALRAHPLGTAAAIVGEVALQPAGIVMVRTAFGGSRIVDLLVGDPLPRIC